MRVRHKKEDEADKWLRAHDPYYSNAHNNKKRQEEYPYETIEQEYRRSSKEIPISNLSAFCRRQLKDVIGAYDENGNFEL